MSSNIVSIYLKGGATAKVTFESADSSDQVRQIVENQLNDDGNKFQIKDSTSLLVLNKDEIVGYSIER